MLDLSDALRPEAQQFVHALQAAGWDETELRALARTWAVAEADINSVLGTPPNEADPHHTEVRIAIIAAQANAAINLRCRPSTPAILNATSDELLEWIAFYEAECDRLYRELIQAQLDHPSGARHGASEWDALHSQFHKLAGFLWEANEVSGVNTLMQAIDS